MDWQTLYCGIRLQPEVIPQVERARRLLTGDTVEEQLERLTDITTAPDAYRKLNELLPDASGVSMLACQLECARRVYTRYRKKGIPDHVFFDTMRCFTRFISEKRSDAVFDRGWWTYRQLSMRLFRIGELEYERSELDGKAALSIHIPSDARFGEAFVERSLEEARSFCATFYPEYADAVFFCESWLLSPALQTLLGKDSNILAFQSRFDILRTDWDAADYLVWAFGAPSDTSDFSVLKEDTSLQKNIKRHILNGGKIGVGFGVIQK